MPPWRIALHVLFFAGAAQRAVAAFLLAKSGAPSALIASAAVQGGALLLVALAILYGRFMVGALWVVALVMVASSALSIAAGVSVPVAISQAALALLSAGALGYFLRRERSGTHEDGRTG